MEVETTDEFFENADQPRNVCHRIHLLRNLRLLKNNVAKRNLQVVKSKILDETNAGNREAVESSTREIETKFTNISDNIRVAQSSNREDESLSKPSLIPFNETEQTSRSGITFLSTIELLGTLYDASKDSVFFQQQERFVNILNAIKKKNTSDKELEHLRSESSKLSQVNNKFERISGA